MCAIMIPLNTVFLILWTNLICSGNFWRILTILSCPHICRRIIRGPSIVQSLTLYVVLHCRHYHCERLDNDVCLCLLQSGNLAENNALCWVVKIRTWLNSHHNSHRRSIEINLFHFYNFFPGNLIEYGIYRFLNRL